MKYKWLAAIAPNDGATPDDGQSGGTGNDGATPEPKDEPLATEGGLKALQAEREQRKALEKQLKALTKKFEGVSPNEFQELLDYKSQQEQAAAAQRQKELEEQKEYEAAKQRLQAEYEEKIANLSQESTSELSKVREAKASIEARYNDLLVSTALSNAFLKANGDPEKLEMLNIPTIRGSLTVVDDKVKVIGADGEATDKPLDEWMGEVKAGKLWLFRPDGTASGGGTPPQVSGGAPGPKNSMSMDDFMRMSPAELARKGRLKANR